MAFNIQTFKTRALTAIVFVLVMAAGLLINHWSFLLLFTIIHFGCWIEYQKLVTLIDSDYQNISSFHRYAVMIGGFGCMLWMLNDAFVVQGIRLHELGWWLMIIVAFAWPLAEILLSKKLDAKLLGYSCAGLLYISLSWGLLMHIRASNMVFAGEKYMIDNGWQMPLIIIVSIWINDTMAYIVGSFIGKTPLSSISPKKTWEGTIGGVILSVLVVGFAAHAWLQHNPNFSGIKTHQWFIIAAIAAIVGTMGDLLESKLKRLAKVKDSGSFMPGHGGFLDRFDSLIVAIPFVWLYLHFFV